MDSMFNIRLGDMEYPENIEIARGLTIVAEDCYKSLLILLKQDMSTKSIGILLGHCLEASLKAHLAHSGWTENDLKNLGHDLKLCWNTATKLKIGISKKPPNWVSGISFSHYNLRYRYPKSYEEPWLPHSLDYMDILDEIIEPLRQDFLNIGGKYVVDF